jgi:hypothetical protein
MLSTKNVDDRKPKTTVHGKADLSLSRPTDTQGGTLSRINPSTGRVFTTPADPPTNRVRIGKFNDHRINVSEPRTAHETGLRNDANDHRRDSAARRLLLSPTSCRIIIQLDNSHPEDLQLRQLHQDRTGPQTTITSTTRAVWSRGKPSNQPTPTRTPPQGKLSETHPQIPRSLLDNNGRHFCPPRLAHHNPITFGPADADPVHNTSAPLHILDGECDTPQIIASHSSTHPRLHAARFRRPGISTIHRSPEHFIIIFGLIVHLGLMIVCVMSNAHYPNLLRSLSKEDFIVWKLVLAAAFL